MNETLERVIKHSVMYGYVLSQPFSVYIDAEPAQDNKVLLEKEQLAYGEHGQTVRVLQKKLAALSYYQDDIDGQYGVYTKQAIKKLQKVHDLEITGHTDIHTIKHMIDEEYNMHLEQLENLSDTIEPHQHGEDVEVVQESLQYFGYYDGDIDGINGPLTKRALHLAEDKHDIQLSEEMIEEMRTALAEIEQFESADNIKQSYIEDTHIENLQNDMPNIYPGMIDEKVEEVQKSLRHLGYYKDDIDGSYGPATKEAIHLAERELNIVLATEQNVANERVSNNDDSNDENDHNDAQDAYIENETESEHVQTAENKQDTEQLEQVKQVEVKQSHDTRVIEAARSAMGTPYVWGGTSRDGFDCSGFVQFAYESADITIPRTVSDIWNFGQPVSDPSVGDLVFFETYKPGPSHMGIYLGNNQFIHAGESSGVSIANMNDSYWQQRYLGAKRIQ